MLKQSFKPTVVQLIGKSLLIAVLLPGLALSSLAIMKASPADAATGVTVTILKYSDGEMATPDSVNSTSFPMSATWNASNIGAGSGEYTLDANGDTPYQAMTVTMDSGADYSTNEILTRDMVGASCDEEKPYSLVGYTTGDTEEEAANAEPSTTIPAFINLTNNKTVIVWNENCEVPPEPTSVKVTISKFIQSAMATSESANSLDFPMSATWETTNLSSGTGMYILGPNNDTPYQAVTADMNPGASYSTNEKLEGENVGASCNEDKPFALTGYTTGDTYDEAMDAEPTLIIPAFTDLQNDKYVIVWNEDCTPTEGEISGDVSGSNGTLSVTSVESLDSDAIADGTFENGWQYAFYITVPSDETNLAMKFDDWTRNGGDGTIPVANNMRISSDQADNDGGTITLTAEDTYSTPTLHMTGDLDPEMDGKQVRVLVEVAVPSSTPNGSYTTRYGVRTTE